jgi:hypothetical protein
MSERRELLVVARERGASRLKKQARGLADLRCTVRECRVLKRKRAVLIEWVPDVGEGIAGEILAAIGALFDEEDWEPNSQRGTLS